MIGLNTTESDKLRSYIEKLERMEEEKRELMEGMRDIIKQAQNEGFDPKIIRKIVRLRKIPISDRLEQEELLDLYLHALNMTMEIREKEPCERE